jgi:hypothetical protein
MKSIKTALPHVMGFPMVADPVYALPVNRLSADAAHGWMFQAQAYPS